MTDKILYWATMFFSSLALVLFLGNVGFIQGNLKIQQTISSKQQTIGIAEKVSPLNQQLSQVLFDLSVKGNDQKIRELLTSQGFVLPSADAMKAPEAAAPAKAPEAPKAKKIQKEEE